VSGPYRCASPPRRCCSSGFARLAARWPPRARGSARPARRPSAAHPLAAGSSRPPPAGGGRPARSGTPTARTAGCAPRPAPPGQRTPPTRGSPPPARARPAQRLRRAPPDRRRSRRSEGRTEGSRWEWRGWCRAASSRASAAGRRGRRDDGSDRCGRASLRLGVQPPRAFRSLHKVTVRDVVGDQPAVRVDAVHLSPFDFRIHRRSSMHIDVASIPAISMTVNGC
jgi:hypothetical protein